MFSTNLAINFMVTFILSLQTFILQAFILGLWNLVGNGRKVPYNIFCLHARFNSKRIARVMSEPRRTKYITILRDPVEIFISAWHYYKLGRCLKMSIGLHFFMPTFSVIFLSDEFARADESIQRKRLPRCNNGRVGANQLLWDFGVDNQDIYNEKRVKRKIGQIEERFNLVMILEQFQVILLHDWWYVLSCSLSRSL